MWTSAEKDSLLTYALSIANQYRMQTVRELVDLVDETDTYDLADVVTITRVDLLDEDNKLVRTLGQGSWEVWGDNATAGQTLYINPVYAKEPYQLRVHGYAPYTLSGTDNPPVVMRAAILALARAEALRRVAAERARFRQWAETNPRGDTSVGELISQINEADSDAQLLLRQIKLIQRPTVAKV